MKPFKTNLRLGYVAAAFATSMLSASSFAQSSALDVDNYQGMPRVFVLTDMGNEPDDQMSMVRLLTYSNELNLEGLVATTSTW